MTKNEFVKLLEKSYNAMVGKNDFTSVNDFMDALNLHSMIRYLTNTGKLDKDDVYILGLIIKILQAVYNNSNLECPVSDEDYDKLYELYLSYTGNDIIGSYTPSNRLTAYHKYPDLRGTLDKIHHWNNADKKNDTRKSFEEWLKSCENRIGRKIPRDTPMLIFPKFDGVSLIFECDKDGIVERVLTRGDVKSNEAVDVSAIFKGIKLGWESDIPYAIKTECVMPLDKFEEYKKEYGDFNSPRSAASSIINNQDGNKTLLKYLRVIQLSAQYENKKFETRWQNIKGQWTLKGKTVQELLDGALKEFDKEAWEKKNQIVIDGLVLEFADNNLREELGRDGAINKYEVAYKFPPETKVSRILSVEFSIGNLGNISPVAKIEPIKINRNTVSSISLGSMDRFNSLQLSPGDEVYVKYDIIPYLDIDSRLQKSGNPPFKAPYKCPACREKLVANPMLMCVNENCPSRMIGKILNYCIKMGIENISVGTITTLFNQGFLMGILDLYSLKNHRKEIMELDGFGKKSTDIILDSIAKKDPVTMQQLLGAIGIAGIGEKTFEKVLRIYHINELIGICKNLKYNKLTSIQGIKDATAEKIVNGINENLQLINALTSSFVKIKDKSSGPIICFTMIRDKNFEKFLESKGYVISNNLTRDVETLIIKDFRETSSKLDKATKYGIEILTIDEAYYKFGYLK